MSWHRLIAAILVCLVPVGCDTGSRAWERMHVIPPEGSTPEETFEQIRNAAMRRDWPRMYGCMTADARRDQISTLITDISQLAYRAEHPERFGRLTEKQMLRAQRCKEVMKKHDLVGRDFSSGPLPGTSLDADRRFFSRCSSWIQNTDDFVRDAWDALADDGASLFEAEAYLTEMRVMDDYAIAKVHNFWDRYRVEGHCHVHFKKINGHWLIDMSPWWIPWGPPLSKVTK